MKKLICAAVVAASMFVLADEAAKKETAPATPAAPAAAEAPKRPQLTPEQRAQMKEQFAKRRAAMKVEMDKKMIEVIKKYGLDDEKAKALWNEQQEAMKDGRRNMMRRPRPAKAPEKPAAK